MNFAQLQRLGTFLGTTKKILEECLQEILKPIRERREQYLKDKAQLIDILRAGSEISREKTNDILLRVKSVFGLNLF
jgi:tryptophanyl-tRNA synthetase